MGTPQLFTEVEKDSRLERKKKKGEFLNRNLGEEIPKKTDALHTAVCSKETVRSISATRYAQRLTTAAPAPIRDTPFSAYMAASARASSSFIDSPCLCSASPMEMLRFSLVVPDSPCTV